MNIENLEEKLEKIKDYNKRIQKKILELQSLHKQVNKTKNKFEKQKLLEKIKRRQKRLDKNYLEKQYLQRQIDNFFIYLTQSQPIIQQFQKEEVIGSDGLQEIQDQIKDQKQLSEKQKNLILQNLWQHKEQQKNIKEQYEEIKKKYQKLTSGNDNFYKIQSYEDDNFFIPSNGDCAFKCLYFCYKQYEENEDFCFYCKEIYVKNSKQFNFGVSTKKLKTIISNINKFLKVQNIVEYQPRYHLEHYKVQSKYVIFLYENHFIVLKDGRNTFKNCMNQLPDIFEKIKTDQSITQDDIKRLFSKQEIQDFTKSYRNELKKEKENVLKEIELDEDDGDSDFEDLLEYQNNPDKKKQMIFADIESYQENEESEQIPYTIGFASIKLRPGKIISDKTDSSCGLIRIVEIDKIDEYGNEKEYSQSLFIPTQNQIENIQQQKEIKNQIKKNEGEILKLAIQNKYESQEYQDQMNQLKQNKKQLKEIQQNYEQRNYQLLKQCMTKEVPFNSPPKDLEDRIDVANRSNTSVQYKFYRQLKLQKHGNTPGELINNFIQMCFDQMGRTRTFETQQYVYFHNGRSYDFYFFIKYINTDKYKITRMQVDGQKILSFNVNEKCKEKQKFVLKFRDFNRILISSLKNISKSMNLSFQKQEISSKDLLIKNFEQYSQNEKLQEIIDEYLFFDCMSLAEAFIKFRDAIYLQFDKELDLLNIQTTSQIAAAYQQQFLKNMENPINIKEFQFVLSSIYQNIELRNFIRGGRTQCNFQWIDHKIWGAFFYLDLNSMYPSGMKLACEKGGYPVLNKSSIVIPKEEFPKYIEKFNNYVNSEDDEKFLDEAYLIICDVYQPPTSDFLFNNVQTKDGKLYCTSDFAGRSIFKKQYYTNWDIFYSIKYNKLEIKKIHSLIYLPEKLQLHHDKMMEKLRNQRKQFQKDNLDVQADNCKLIMNSIYGKLIQKTIMQKTSIVNNIENFKKQTLDKVFQDFKIGESTESKNQQYVVQYTDFSLKLFAQNISDPVLGAFLLAITKHIMNQIIIKSECYKFDPENIQKYVVYSDTDSIIVGRETYEKIEKLGYIGDDLGQIKLEHVVKDGYEGYGKKIYRFIDEFGNYQSRFKGISFQKIANKSEKDVQEVVNQCFEALQKGERQLIQFDNFTRKLKNQSIIVKQQEKEIDQTFHYEKTMIDYGSYRFYQNNTYFTLD